MPANEPVIAVSQFLGLRNKVRAELLPPGSLVRADNIDLDDNGGMERRQGYTIIELLPNISAAYATRDEGSLFVVSDGTLHRVLSLSPFKTVEITTGIGSGRIAWTDAGNYVFVTGALHGVIVADEFKSYDAFGGPDVFVPETIQSQSIATTADAVGALAAPRGQHIAFADGRIWIAYYDAAIDQSLIFRSRPFRWGAWDLFSDHIPISGRIALLTDVPGGVLIGTNADVQLYAEGSLQQLAGYGVVPGVPFDRDDSGTVFFWTVRGLCRATPFQAITGDRVSVEPGARCAVSLSRSRGVERVLVATSGTSTADNPY